MKRILLSAVAASALLGACTPDSDDSPVVLVEVDQGMADAALLAMGLSGEGSNQITFESSDFTDGVYTFTNVTIRPPDNGDDEEELSEPGPKNTDKGDQDVSDFDPEEIHADRMLITSPYMTDTGTVMMSAFALEAISVEDDDSTTTVTLERFAVDQPNTIMAAELAAILLGDLDDDFEPSWDRYEFGNVSMDGFAVHGTDDDGDFAVTLNRFAMNNQTSDELGRFEIMNFAIDAVTETGPLNIRLGELSIDGLRTSAFSGLMNAIAEDAGGDAVSQAYLQSMANKSMDTYDDFALRDVLVDAGGVNVSLDSLTGTMTRDGDVIRSHTGLNSMTLSADASQASGAQLASALTMLGYEQINLSFAGETVYDEAAGRVYTAGENYILLEDGMRIDFTQDFGGYDAYFEAMERFFQEGSDTDDVASLMRPLLINQFSIRLEDLSLLERGLNAGANLQGIPVEQLRAQTGMMIGMGLLSAPPEIPRAFVTELSTASTTFVNQGGSLTIDLSPQAPVSIGDLMDQAEAGTVDFDSLGLTIVADAPD
jgi:hypothetical protein